MAIHVFVGVGPANLHRALKIQKIDPQAKLVFIDDRIKGRIIDREPARANIFRFETDEVTDKLIKDGINEQELAPLIYKREFSVPQGFQEGDDRVFSNKPFTQIQIRDLQILLMQTIDKKGEENKSKPLMLSQKLTIEDETKMQTEIANLIYTNQTELKANADKLDLHIHVATGALRNDDEKNSIIYPDKAAHNMQTATADIQAMTITPVHGTTTFFIPEPHKDFLDRLKKDQRSLDHTPWQKALEKFDWSLIRPPRIRVFYANDVLYIGAEIPANMMKIKDKKEYENAVTDYTRTIASLVFPNMPINELPVNKFLRSRFPTARGERGEVISTKPTQELAWGDGVTKSANVTISTHGDSRYLPHYQTGSGFVTAFLQNELYEEIYTRKTFADLVTLANEKSAKIATADGQTATPMTVEKIHNQYLKLCNNNESDAIKAFQNELFMTFSRDIIDENKKKVGRYLNAIHSQALNALGNDLDGLITIYNRHHHTQLSPQQLQNFNPSQVIIELLKTDNIGFLKEVMPQLLNTDFNGKNDHELLRLRDLHRQDFESNLHLSRKERDKLTATQHGIHGIITNNVKEKIDYITSEPAHLVANIKHIAESLRDNKTLHQRAFISLFTGVHSATINNFAKKVGELIDKHQGNQEALQKEAHKALVELQSSLEKGNSRRTMAALQGLVQEAVERIQNNTEALRP